jgi:hypothetical protein
MDAAVAAIVGASLGACGTLVGTLITARYQVAREVRVRRSERKDLLYGNAIRSLLRARNRRSGIRVGASAPHTFISEEDIGKFFDDLIDAQHSVAMLLTACGESQRRVLVETSAKLDGIVETLVDAGPRTWAAKGSAPGDLSQIYGTVVLAARADIEP